VNNLCHCMWHKLFTASYWLETCISRLINFWCSVCWNLIVCRSDSLPDIQWIIYVTVCIESSVVYNIHFSSVWYSLTVCSQSHLISVTKDMGFQPAACWLQLMNTFISLKQAGRTTDGTEELESTGYSTLPLPPRLMRRTHTQRDSITPSVTILSLTKWRHR